VLELVHFESAGSAPDQAAHVGLTFRQPTVVQSGAEVSHVMKTVRSQFDGNYLFDLVPAGHYIVRVRAGQSVRGVEIEQMEIPVVVTREQPNPEGLDLRLTSRQRKPPALNRPTD